MVRQPHLARPAALLLPPSALLLPPSTFPLPPFRPLLTRLIELCLRHRAAVLLATCAVLGGGAYALANLDVDAFPDTTPVMVQVNTVAPALGPEEIERQITYPVEQSLSGLPGLENVRSVSKYGFSQVVVTFGDGTDIYFARQVVGERLATVGLPAGVGRPEMGPVATGLGEVFHYVLTYPGIDFTELPPAERERLLTELRTTHDWVVAPQLRQVSGTAEVNSWGGYEKQFQVKVDPAALLARGLTPGDVAEALRRNNRSVGGGTWTGSARCCWCRDWGGRRTWRRSARSW